MPRATPLPADERRAAIMVATEPLLERFGRQVSTRQIAEAAGIAEGTIFRVFASKDALVDAVIEDVFDVAAIGHELEAITLTDPLETRLTRAVAVLERRMRRIFTLFHALDLAGRRPHNHDDVRERRTRDNQLLVDALARLIEPDARRLRVSPEDAARMLRTVTMATLHPMLGDERISSTPQVVDLVLHGVLDCRAERVSAC